MKKYIWKLLIAVGVIPLILPFILGVYHVNLESWRMGDWLILYSYVYWPTYVLGVVLIVAGMVWGKRRKGMGFISFSLKYYEKELKQLETTPVTAETYKAKQLLKMLDDLVDEGYTELNERLEEKHWSS